MQVRSLGWEDHLDEGWQPTRFLPGKSPGRRSLVGCSPRHDLAIEHALIHTHTHTRKHTHPIIIICQFGYLYLFITLPESLPLFLLSLVLLAYYYSLMSQMSYCDSRKIKNIYGISLMLRKNKASSDVRELI